MKKLSKAARETLLDRACRSDYRDELTWSYWFGWGNNASTRELETAGLVESVRFGWSQERVITRDGWELAQALHTERLRQQNGVPMSEYRLEPLIPLQKPGWISAEVKREKWWYTDGHICAQGQSLSTKIEGSRLTAETFIEDFPRYLSSDEKAAKFADCSPIGAQRPYGYGCRGEWVVWFDCGECLGSRYYSHVLRLFPKATWKYAKRQGPLHVMVDGKVVAIVMPMRSDHVPVNLAGDVWVTQEAKTA
jgi:hypothetical protein